MTRGAIQRMQRYRSLEIFATALGQIDLSEGRNLRPRPLLLGALAIHSYADNLLDYVRPREPYLAAGSAVEIDAEDSAWGAGGLTLSNSNHAEACPRRWPFSGSYFPAPYAVAEIIIDWPKRPRDDLFEIVHGDDPAEVTG